MASDEEIHKSFSIIIEEMNRVDEAIYGGRFRKDTKYAIDSLKALESSIIVLKKIHKL